MYLIRLDDASEYMDIQKWTRMEDILDRYNIKPIVGIIPNNEDKELVNNYSKNLNFWESVEGWKKKGWEIALHGFNHVCSTNDGGINPVNNRSEFAGVPIEIQRQKIREGIKIFKSKKLIPKVFFAPSHTFDMNTLEALKRESEIRIISDTIANDIYKTDEFYFIPQQSGHVQKLPLNIVTFCYHPNIMQESEFVLLESFIKENTNRFGNFEDIIFKDRKLSFFDMSLRKSYFIIRKLRRKLRG